MSNIFKKAMSWLGTAIILVASTLFPGIVNDEKDYAALLDNSGIFDNTYAEALPQTVVHGIITDFFNAPLPSGKTAKKCLLIGFDGTTAQSCLNTVDAAKSGINLLRQNGGKLYQAYTGGDFPLWQDSSTAPGWATMLTGKWAKEWGGHLVLHNGFIKANYCKTVLTQLVESGKIDKTAFLVSWKGHLENITATYKKEAKYTKDKGYNMRWETLPGDSEVYDAALGEINDPNGADMIFPIIEKCDSTGHSTGFAATNPLYINAFKESDTMAYDMINAVKARGTYASEEWLIIISTDHGGIKVSHGGISPNERQIFICYAVI